MLSLQNHQHWNPVSQNSSSNQESNSEEIIKSDEKERVMADEASSQYSSASSEDEYMKSTPTKRVKKLGVNQSLDLYNS